MWDLDHKEECEEYSILWMSKNWCFWIVVLEKTQESLGQQGDQTSQSYRKSSLNIHWKDWCWIWNFNTWATWCEELTHWKRPWCWERLKAGGEGGNRWWDGWKASLTEWTWVWVNFGRQWRTGKPVFCSLWDHKDLDMTEQLNWTELNWGRASKVIKNIEECQALPPISIAKKSCH